MGKTKFEEIKEKTEKKEEKSELEQKKEELEQKTERLEKIPKEKDEINLDFTDGMEMQKIKIRVLELQYENPGVRNPYYDAETTSEWQLLRKNEMKLRMKFEGKKLTSLEEQLKARLKSMNEQESRIKEELPRIKKDIERLSK